MASVAFGSTMAAVAPASCRRQQLLRRTQLAATRGTQSSAPKKEKSILDFIVGAIYKEDQVLLETDPLLNKVDSPAPPTASRKAGDTTSGGKKPTADGGGGGFNLGGLFAKKG